MSGSLTATNWSAGVGYLPPVLDSLAFNIAQERGVGSANACAEALVTIRDLAKSGRTFERDLTIRESTRGVLREALAEWELMRAFVAASEMSEAKWLQIDEAADSLVKATTPEPIGKPGGPGLWHHKGLQLPAYIQHIAQDLMKKRGMTESRAIAVAIGAVKRWAAGAGKVDATTQAAAKLALGEWEKLKATHSATEGAKSSLVRSVDRLQHIVSPLHGQSSIGGKFAHRVSVIEGMLSALKSRHPELTIRSAEKWLGEAHFDDDFDYSDPELEKLAEAASVDLSPKGRAQLADKGKAMPGGGYPIPNVEFLKKAISAFGRAKNKAAAKAWIVKRAKALNATNLLPDGWDVQEARDYVTVALQRELVVQRALMEALGYGTTPIRGRESGSKGKFHGMHGVERAVRTRTHIPDNSEEHPVLAAKAKGTSLTEAPFTEELHPRVAGGAGGGEFQSKGGAQQQGQGAQGQGGGAGAQPAAVPVKQQLNDRLSSLGYNGDSSLKEFQQSNGLPATGTLDAGTVDALRSASPVEQAEKQLDTSLAAAPAVSTAQQNRIAVSNDQLQAVGYPDTASGISQFQKDYGMPVTGSLDPDTMAALATVYGNNARTSKSKAPDFTGIAGPGAKVNTRPRRASKGTGVGGTPAPAGRTTLGKSSIKEAIDGLLVEADETGFGQEFDASVYGGPVARSIVGPLAREREDGDDFDFDELPIEPPGLREGDGVRFCDTCPHFARGAMLGPHLFGGCMLYTWPVDRHNVCDDWTTLTPEDASVVVAEAGLREAERAGDTDAIVLARVRLASARKAAREADPVLHLAHKDRAGLTVEEALTPLLAEAGAFDEAKHPRGRGGKWAFTGRLRALGVGASHTHMGVKVTHTGVHDGERMYRVDHGPTGTSQQGMYGERVPADAVHQALRRQYEAQALKSAGTGKADLKGAQERARRDAPPEAHMTGPSSSHPDYPGSGRSPATARAQQVAQDRHRTIQNKNADQVEAAAEKMISRRVSAGNNESESRTMLADLMSKHSGTNLASALVHNGFASEKDAHKFAGGQVVASGTAANGKKIESVVFPVGNDGEKNSWRADTKVDGNAMATSHHSSQDEAASEAQKMNAAYMDVHGGDKKKSKVREAMERALVLDSLNEVQRAFLVEQEGLLAEGGEVDEHLGIYLDTLLEEAA